MREHFKDRPGDLLELDVCSGEGYAKLCSFLSLPMPEDAAFPIANSTSDKTSQLKWIKQVKGVYDVLSEVIPAGAPVRICQSESFAGTHVAERWRLMNDARSAEWRVTPWCDFEADETVPETASWARFHDGPLCRIDVRLHHRAHAREA